MHKAEMIRRAVLAKDFEARLDTLLQRRAGMSRIRLGISRLLFIERKNVFVATYENRKIGQRTGICSCLFLIAFLKYHEFMNWKID